MLNDQKKILALRYFIGALFIISGLAKLFPIIAFEMQLVQQGFSNWVIVTWFARGIIAFELFLGLSFFQKNFLKRFFIPAAILLLIIFSLDLIRTIIMNGFTGNCGCFGQIIIMTPLEALIKNIVLVAALLYLSSLLKKDEPKKLLVSFSFFVIAFLPVLVLFPTGQFHNADSNNRESITFDSNGAAKNNVTKNKKSDGPIKYSNSIKENVLTSLNNFSDNKTVNLRVGKNIVALLSMDCGDCFETASSIQKLSKQVKLPPVYFLLWGDEGQVPNFLKETKAKFPYKLVDPGTLSKLSDGFVPKVYFLNNGKIIREWDYKTFSIEKLRDSLK